MCRTDFLVRATLAGLILGLGAGPVWAEISRREANQLAVDVLTLKIGGDVRGVILDRSPEKIAMAVRRDWLRANQPALLKAGAANNESTQRSQQLVERIDAWLADLGEGNGKVPYSPKPVIKPADETPMPAQKQNEELLRVLQAERDVYQEYIDDPLKLPPGEGDAKARREAYGHLVNRLDGWIAELQGGEAPHVPAGEAAESDQLKRQELIRILKSERETYLKRAKADDQTGDDPSEFVRVELSRADVNLVFAQSPERKQLVMAAYQQGFADVEQTTIADLQQQLTANNIDWQDTSADPSQLIGETLPQSDREWAARRAIYEYQFLKRLDFQGTGNYIAQTGEGAPPPNLAEALQGTLDQQMSTALGDLLDEPIFTGLDFGGLGGAKNKEDWKTKAIRIAEKQNVRGFRVTRVTPDLQRRQSLVEDAFFAKMPDGHWETIWQLRETKSAANANQGDLDRIKEDPQLKEVLGLVEGLGLGAGGNLDLALQFGAATMNAQQATDDEFYEFRDRYSERLDGPPLSWK